MYEKNKGLVGLLNFIAEWIMRLLYLNLLWILSTLLGLIVFGLFPATASLFTIARHWINGNDEINVWKTFWESYRKYFIKANIIGLVFLIIGWILRIDLIFFQTQSDNVLFLFLAYFSIFMFIIYMIVGLFLFPVFAHYELKVLQHFRQSFLIVFLCPMEAIMTAAGFILVYYLMYFTPALILFLGVSTLGVVTTWTTNRAFNKLQLRMEKIKKTEDNSL